MSQLLSGICSCRECNVKFIDMKLVSGVSSIIHPRLLISHLTGKGNHTIVVSPDQSREVTALEGALPSVARDEEGGMAAVFLAAPLVFVGYQR